jgi:hypothetical protein
MDPAEGFARRDISLATGASALLGVALRLALAGMDARR